MSNTNTHKDKRMASFRLKNETIAKLNFLVSEGLAHSKTSFIERYIEAYYEEYIKTEGIDDATAINEGFAIMFNDSKPKNFEGELHNKKVIRDMEIQRAKEMYMKATNTRTESTLNDMLNLLDQPLEELLIEQGMLKPE